MTDDLCGRSVAHFNFVSGSTGLLHRDGDARIGITDVRIGTSVALPSCLVN